MATGIETVKAKVWDNIPVLPGEPFTVNAPPIRKYPESLIKRHPDYRELDLSGLPSIAEMGASLAELREYYWGWLADRNNKEYPFNINRFRQDLICDNAFCVRFSFHSKDKDGKRNPDHFQRWAELGRDILFMPEVIWQGTRPLIPVELIGEYIGDPQLVFDPIDIRYDFPDHELIKKQVHIRQIEIEGRSFYDFDPPNTYYYWLASSVRSFVKMSEAGLLNAEGLSNAQLLLKTLPVISKRSLEKMSEEGLLKPELLSKTLPAISFLVEINLIEHEDTARYIEEINKLPELIGGEEGFAAAAAVLDDHWKVYQPFFKNGVPGTNLREPDKIFLSARDELRKKYQIWRYENRPEAIPDEARQKATLKMQLEEDPIKRIYAYLEETYNGAGAERGFDEIYKSSITIRLLLEKAKQEKKMEAGVIPVTADIQGFNEMDSLAFITALTHGLWTAILYLDDTIDQSQKRGNKATYYKTQGIPSAIRQPLLAMISSAREATEKVGINNNLLTGSILTMLDELYQGDEKNSYFGFDDNFQIIEENMRQIMQVLAWFPKYAAKVDNMAEDTGLALAEFLENYGILMLIKNDFDNLNVGDDFGSRINTFMYAFYHSEEIPLEKREDFRAICDDPDINYKKNQFIPLNKGDRQKIARALELGRQYRREAARWLSENLRKYYDNALKALDTAARSLPSRDHRLDWRNQLNFEFLRDSLDAYWGKLQSYAAPENVQVKNNPYK